jgi:tetratricopeptide (TPR) repeat protein
MPDRLRRLWDFDDLEATEQRFRAQLDAEETDSGRAEVLTQLARVQGLRGEFDACEQLVREAESLAGDSAIAEVRIDLERGRKLRSSGDAEGSVPFFETAFSRACENRLYYLAGDAAHMVAIADERRMLAWTQRGLDLAEAEPDAAYWAGPLLNNLGWHYFEAGDYETALATFERALEVREREPTNPDAIAFAREAVESALEALRRKSG